MNFMGSMLCASNLPVLIYVHFESFAVQLITSSWHFQSQLLDALQLLPQDSWSHNIRVGIMAILQNRVGMLIQFADLCTYYFTFFSQIFFLCSLIRFFKVVSVPASLN